MRWMRNLTSGDALREVVADLSVALGLSIPVRVPFLALRDLGEGSPILEDVTEATDPPDGDVGVACDGARYLHVEVTLPDEGSSITYRLHTRSLSGLWSADYAAGEDGIVTVSRSAIDAAGSQADVTRYEVAGGAVAVYVEIVSVDSLTAGATVRVFGS